MSDDRFVVELAVVCCNYDCVGALEAACGDRDRSESDVTDG